MTGCIDCEWLDSRLTDCPVTDTDEYAATLVQHVLSHVTRGVTA